MRKPFLITFLCLITSVSFVNAQEYAVQLAAFDREVPISYFRGIDDVFHTVDHNDIHRYYIGGLNSANEAQTMASKTKKMGYNARMVDLAELREQCAMGCAAPTSDPSTITWLFFDFDKAGLRSSSKNELNKLYNIMVNNPDYRVELKAHTDSKGSAAYNIDLSQRRSKSAMNYLISMGVDANRVNHSAFGEDSPIAVNELDGGQDSAHGRQLNRRVEVHIYDGNGKAMDALVQTVAIPNHLRG